MHTHVNPFALLFHVIMTFLTGGLWLIVLLVKYILEH